MLFSYFSRVTQHTNDILHIQKYILSLKITRNKETYQEILYCGLFVSERKAKTKSGL